MKVKHNKISKVSRRDFLKTSAAVSVAAMTPGSHSIYAGLYRLTEPFSMLAGASQRHIFDLGDMKNSLRIIPTGISGNFMSDHYDDQAERWRQVEYRPFFLEREDVEKDAAYHLTMVPCIDE